ncbi:hypothetical protein EGW08_014941 [Elysia chlorotica]|uniref:Uncharacterized protein n=1 Tax=Elysia chlorotica TaxID=188477 RepID=A0A3S0ZGV0_ELYCH|nr:hypothetical protein EGW08_014941 [Elysia chlorotica]
MYIGEKQSATESTVFSPKLTQLLTLFLSTLPIHTIQGLKPTNNLVYKYTYNCCQFVQKKFNAVIKCKHSSRHGLKRTARKFVCVNTIIIPPSNEVMKAAVK